MIQINQLKLRWDHSPQAMEKAIRKKLGMGENQPFTYKIFRRSLDARKKPELFFVYSVGVTVGQEEKILRKVHDINIMSTNPEEYAFPVVGKSPKPPLVPPVIVGFGPAGMFAALFLARAGLCPVVLERGEAVERRAADVERFWQDGVLNVHSNVQFGEGGAGTFSDGKLNTLIKDPGKRIRKVLETFVEFGAKEEILYMNKPHIGTDELCRIVRNIREEIKTLGGQIYFHTCFEGFYTARGRLAAVVARDTRTRAKREVACKFLVLAIGHSARDTFSILAQQGVAMQPKAFAVGLRIEHPQTLIDFYAYGQKRPQGLGAAEYKVTSGKNQERGVYSFCMCPGGYVVNASSEAGMTAVNGMSYSGRGGENANSALIVTVTPQDFGEGILAGMEFQRRLEQAAYREGAGGVPLQLLGDFKENRPSTGFGRIRPAVKGAFAFGNLRAVLPDFLNQPLLSGIAQFDAQIPGFDMADAILSGVESRTSSPVRILRNDAFESGTPGIYPCGEGAGYAGGITSAAVDGIKTAEMIAKAFIMM